MSGPKLPNFQSLRRSSRTALRCPFGLTPVILFYLLLLEISAIDKNLFSGGVIGIPIMVVGSNSSQGSLHPPSEIAFPMENCGDRFDSSLLCPSSTLPFHDALFGDILYCFRRRKSATAKSSKRLRFGFIHGFSLFSAGRQQKVAWIGGTKGHLSTVCTDFPVRQSVTNLLSSTRITGSGGFWALKCVLPFMT
jgi:hypothetical protein